MAVAFDEEGGSPRYSGSRTELSAVRSGFIAWADINALFAELFPGSILGVPQLPAILPGSFGLYADSVEFAPLDENQVPSGSTSVVATYGLAHASINYKTIPYQSEGDNILTRRHGIAVEMMTLPNTGLVWEDGSPITNPEVTAGKQIQMIEHSLTLHQVESIPFAAIRDLVGAVNDATFEDAEAETILFSGAEMRQIVKSGGEEPWEVDLRFLEKRINTDDGIVGWNHIYDPFFGIFRRVKTAAANENLYPIKDMDGLL